MKKYVAAFYEENGGNYSVFLADYDAATCGDDIEDAREMAKDILSIYIEDEGAKEQPKDINEVDLAELYIERTGLKLSDRELLKAHKEYISV